MEKCSAIKSKALACGRCVAPKLLAALLLLLVTVYPSHAQSRFYGTLEPIKTYGPCTFPKAGFDTDSRVQRISLLWTLRDTSDTTVSKRGLSLTGGAGRSMPSSFVSEYHTIPGTVLTYTSAYKLGEFDKKRKRVPLLKQSWVYTGWGANTKVYCYGAWASEVKYK